MKRALLAYAQACVLGWVAIVAHAEPVDAKAAESPEMAKARAMLKSHHGDQINSLILGERFEYHSNGGNAEAVWEAQAWIGGDLQKLWLKTEGDYATKNSAEGIDSGFEEFELQALYSRAISPFWDLQTGIRHDITPNPSRTYAVVGVQGLAPYWFELDGALFLSDTGDLSARVEAEYEFRLTQRLFLQPRLELNLALANDTATGTGSGLSTAQGGLRLRYEFTRSLAPYVGVSWSRAFGNTADYRRLDNESTNQVSFVAGLRFWF